jgi:chromosome segregation ATPase
MTIIGKILTFLIFVFSLLFLGFAILINQTNKDPRSKKSWVTVAYELEKSIHDYESDIKNLKEENSAALAQTVALQRELDATKQRVEVERKELNDKVTNAQNAMEVAVNKFRESQVVLKTAQDDVEKKTQENLALSERIKQKDSLYASLNQNFTSERNLRTETQIENGTLKERNAALEQNVQRLAHELEDSQTRGLQRARAAGQGANPQPPPNDVQGEVLAVSETGLVSINKGSDHGLAKNQTLEIYRMSPRAEWVARVRLIEVNNHESIGQVVLPTNRKVSIQKGDLTGSTILPTAGR